MILRKYSIVSYFLHFVERCFSLHPKHSSVSFKIIILTLINILSVSMIEELKQNLLWLVCFYYCSATPSIFMFRYFLLLPFFSSSLLLFCFCSLLLLSVSFQWSPSFHLFHLNVFSAVMIPAFLLWRSLFQAHSILVEVSKSFSLLL